MNDLQYLTEKDIAEAEQLVGYLEEMPIIRRLLPKAYQTALRDLQIARQTVGRAENKSA